jgi:hypothetical protein
VELKGRTVDKSLADIVQAGVDIVFLKQRLTEVLLEANR